MIIKGQLNIHGSYNPQENIPQAQAAMEKLLKLAGVRFIPWSLAGQVEAGDGDAGFPVL